jgi:hypothetical protein
MLFQEHWAWVVQAAAVALEDRRARVIRWKQAARRECRTRGQADEVEHIRHGCFIEIVDAPDKPALAVTPRPVVLGMNIADRQEVRCIVQLRAQSSIFRAQR